MSILATAPKKPEQRPTQPQVSFQSRASLNAANFFLAEITGVVMPFLGDYLKERQWSESAFGVAICARRPRRLPHANAGRHDRRPRAAAADTAGRRVRSYSAFATACCRWCRPSPAGSIRCCSLPALRQAFFLPAARGAGAGAGRPRGARTGRWAGNQGWNHAGNLAAALLAMGLVSLFGVAVRLLRGARPSRSWRPAPSSSFARTRGGRGPRQRRADNGGKGVRLRELLKDRRVLGAAGGDGALFHLANAPVMPFLGAYIKKLDGSRRPGRGGGAGGPGGDDPRGPGSPAGCATAGAASGFSASASSRCRVRIFLYSLTQDPWTLVALQALDGIGAGIYGVVIVAICADLTKGKGGFNALSGHDGHRAGRRRRDWAARSRFPGGTPRLQRFLLRLRRHCRRRGHAVPYPDARDRQRPVPGGAGG